MEREQTITLVLFFLLVGSILPAAYINFFVSGTKSDDEQEPQWIVYTDSELEVKITRVENILTIEGFSSASKEEAKSALESIPGVRSVNIRSPILNQNPTINAAFIHNASISLEEGTDQGYVDFKIRRRLGDVFPEFVNFSGNPIVTQRGKAEALAMIQGTVQGIDVVKSLNGSGIEFDVILLPQTRAGEEISISASVVTYNDTVLAGSGWENPRYLIPPMLTENLLLNGTVTAFSSEYLLSAMVPWENRVLNESMLNGTRYDYNVYGRIVANVSGLDQLNLSLALANMSGIESVYFEEENMSIELAPNSSGENVSAWLETLSISYAFADLPIILLAYNTSGYRMAEITDYLSFTHELEAVRGANITFQEEILIGNETYYFYDNPLQEQVPYNLTLGEHEFNATLQIVYDEVLGFII